MVQDDSLCLTDIPVLVTQPDTLTRTLSTLDIACFGDGRVCQLVGTGGVRPYRYALNGGAVPPDSSFLICLVRAMNWC